MERRGVSGVVVSLLLVLIAVVAVSIVAVLIYSFSRSSSIEFENKATSIAISGQLEASIMEYVAEKNVSLNVKRKTGQENITGIIFLLKDINGKSFLHNKSVTLDEFNSITVFIDYSKEGLNNLSSIDIVPVFRDSSGKEVVSSSPNKIPESKFKGGGGGGGGGSSTTPDPTPTASCTDNTKNQDELGIDCGGVCGSCLVIALVSPSNGSVVNQASNNFVANIYSSSFVSNITNVTLYVWNSTNNLVNTMLMNLNNESYLVNLTYTLPREGMYSWGYLTTDNVTGIKWSSNYSINYTLTFVDNVAPLLTINSPSGSYSNALISFNVSSNEALSYCKYSINNWATNTTMNSISATSYFAQQSLANGNYVARFWCNDTYGNVNSTQSSSFSVNVVAPDTQAPSVTNLVSSPTSGATYSAGAIYRFNATVTDSSGVSSVRLSFNNRNYTATLSGGVYTASITDLPAGTYSYNWIANDTVGNVNTTSSYTFTINKASVSLTLANSPSDSVSYGTATTTTGSGCASGLVCNLHLSNNPVSNPYSATLASGTHNFVYNTTGNQNYSSSTVSRTLTVSQTGSSTTVSTSPASPATYPTSTTFNCVQAQGLSTTMTINSVDKSSEKGLSLIRGAGTYPINCSFAGNVNYAPSSQLVNYVVSQSSSNVDLFVNGSRSSLNIYPGTAVMLNASLISGQFGLLNLTVNGIQVASGATNLSNLYTFNTIGTFVVTASYLGNQNYSVNSESWNVIVSAAPDTQAPSVTNLVSSPTSPATYSAGAIYRFNATVTDSSGVSSVKLVFDSKEYTASLSGGVYTAIITDLPAGTYIYNWIANDTLGNVQLTSSYSYTINKASVSLTLANSPSDSVSYGTATTTTGSGCTSGIVCNLHLSNNPVSNPYSATLASGTHNFVYNTTGNQNYSSSTVSRTLTVNKATSSVTVLTNPAVAVYPTTTNFSCSSNVPTNMTIGGVDKNNEKGIYVLRSAGSYIVNCSFAGNQNYSASSNQVIYSITQGSSSTTLSTTPTNSVVYPATSNFSCSNNVGAISTLYINGVNRSTEMNLNLIRGVNSYTVNCTTLGNSNYTGSSIQTTYLVNKSSSTTTVSTTPTSPIVYPTSSTFDCVQAQGLSTIMFVNGSDNTAQEGISVVRPAGTYTINCSYVGNQNYSASSSVATYQINSPGVCNTSTNTFENVPISAQYGNFSFEFDATPLQNNMNGLALLSNAPGAAYTAYSVLLGFNSAGITARNGGVYSSDTAVPYTAGTTYHFNVSVNVPASTYSVRVTPQGGSTVLLANNYNFRTEATNPGSINNYGYVSDTGSYQLCNAQITYSSNPICGNGQIQAGETCDDGNTNNGDGCNSTCSIQLGWTCNGQPSLCNAVVDNTKPIVNLTSPINGYNTTTLVNTFNADLSDNYLLSNATLYVWNSTGSLIGTGPVVVLSGNLTNVSSSVTLPVSGNRTYKWNYHVVDYFGNSNWSSINRTINYVNAYGPLNGILNTPVNNTITNQASMNLTVNVSDDEGVKNATVSVRNSTGSTVFFQTTTLASNVVQATVGAVAALVDGTYTWFYSLYDISGNNFITGNSTLTIDTIAPMVNLTSPTSTTYTSSPTSLEFKASDRTNITACWYSTNGGITNISIAC
jgi:cysteine-rich repeat protein